MRAGALLAVLWLGPALAVEDGPTLMSQLESRLLSARHIAVEAVVEATGAVTARLKGRSALLECNRATWTYSGTFDGAPANLSLVADGRFVRLRSSADRSEVPAGPEANRALLLGLTRMGLFHNLARLSQRWAADHADGGVDNWVRLDAFRPTTYPQGGPLAGTLAFGFDFLVNGSEAGSARVWIDPKTGLPKRRQHTVRYPKGEVNVVETYTRFEVR